MQKKVAQQVALRILSILVIIGGLVRLVANAQTFQSFMIGELWISHPYFIYIYRMLGAFVVSTGVTMFIIAHDPVRYAIILKVWGFCFLFVAIIMFLVGYFLRMTFIHYAFDFTFCVLIALTCFSFGKG